MFRKLRPRSAYDAIALLALLIAVGTGGAYAANTIGSSDIIDESILSQDIKNGQVQWADLANSSITGGKIKDGAVVGADVADGSLTGADVAESTLAKVPDADKLDGKDSTAFVVKCPSGTTSHAGACFETASRTAETFSSASRTCGVAGRRLPTWSELESLRQEPGITISDGTDYELTSNIYEDNSLNDVILGIDQGGNRFGIQFATAKRFRCVAPYRN